MLNFASGGFGQNILIFVVDMSSSAHIDNKKKDILVFGKGPTQGLKHALTAEKMYSINFTLWQKRNSVYITTEKTVIYLLITQKFTNLKQKIQKL